MPVWCILVVTYYLCCLFGWCVDWLGDGGHGNTLLQILTFSGLVKRPLFAVYRHSFRGFICSELCLDGFYHLFTALCNTTAASVYLASTYLLWWAYRLKR